LHLAVQSHHSRQADFPLPFCRHPISPAPCLAAMQRASLLHFATVDRIGVLMSIDSFRSPSHNARDFRSRRLTSHSLRKT
jgi:hypothetical protein